MPARLRMNGGVSNGPMAQQFRSRHMRSNHVSSRYGSDIDSEEKTGESRRLLEGLTGKLSVVGAMVKMGEALAGRSPGESR